MARLGQFRRGTLDNWVLENPVIADGEFILIATDSNFPRKYDRWTVGDGISTFAELGFRSIADFTEQKEIPPFLRLNLTTGNIEYSYDEIYWSILLNKLEITPTVSIKVGTVGTLPAGSQARIIVTDKSTSTKSDLVLNFDLPMGFTGAAGQKGDGWKIKAILNTINELPQTSNIVGDTYLIGTTTPYTIYVWKDEVSGFVNIGMVSEIKAGVFDGGRADTVYGGVRTIDCGGADAFIS